jgi:hypothetical protein
VSGGRTMRTLSGVEPMSGHCIPQSSFRMPLSLAKVWNRRGLRPGGLRPSPRMSAPRRPFSNAGWYSLDCGAVGVSHRGRPPRWPVSIAHLPSSLRQASSGERTTHPETEQRQSGRLRNGNVTLLARRIHSRRTTFRSPPAPTLCGCRDAGPHHRTHNQYSSDDDSHVDAPVLM